MDQQSDMSRLLGSVLLRRFVVLLLFGTGTSALPNRTGAVRLTQYETIDSNNMQKMNKSSTEFRPELHSSGAEGRGRALGSGGESGPVCAYRSLGAGDPGRLCFRYNQPDFRCPSASCRQVRAPGGQLTANILSNSSVFIQWRVSEPTGQHGPGHAPGQAPQDAAAPPKSPMLGQRGQLGGFRLSCWWNGSYTQFECAGVHLGSGCRDYLLNELHTNVPYRLCLRPYAPEQPDVCVQFSLTPSGMQDIVIAMTTVGGAICVMLVIICLLVAYITENIMNPSMQHTRTSQHSHRSHLHTHL